MIPAVPGRVREPKIPEWVATRRSLLYSHSEFADLRRLDLSEKLFWKTVYGLLHTAVALKRSLSNSRLIIPAIKLAGAVTSGGGATVWASGFLAMVYKGLLAKATLDGKWSVLALVQIGVEA